MKELGESRLTDALLNEVNTELQRIAPRCSCNGDMTVSRLCRGVADIK